MDDRQIVEQILQGRTEMYGEIVRRYQQNVANLTFKMFGTRLDVEEVTQQVFVEMYYALPRFRFESKISSYLYRITVNVCCKMMKHEGRVMKANDGALEVERVSGEQNREQQMIHDEEIEQLREAIAKLKEEQRTALVLYVYEDLSYQDIADVMQCSLSKVESLIFRAKKNLSKMMEK